MNSAGSAISLAKQRSWYLQWAVCTTGSAVQGMKTYESGHVCVHLPSAILEIKQYSHGQFSRNTMTQLRRCTLTMYTLIAVGDNAQFSQRVLSVIKRGFGVRIRCLHANRLVPTRHENRLRHHWQVWKTCFPVAGISSGDFFHFPQVQERCKYRLEHTSHKPILSP